MFFYKNENNSDIGLLLLRIVLGIVFFVHGTQKVFGWFGGSGLEKWGDYLSTFSSPKHLSPLIAIAELLFGITILVGVFTKISSLVAFVFMIFAIFLAHYKNGFFVNKGGYEYALVLAVASLVLFFTNAGKYSIDHQLIK